MAALISVFDPGAAAAEKAIIIGGGPNLKESQGQIEQNVVWLQAILPRLGYQIDMYYGNGNESGDDVTYVDVDAPNIDLRMPLAEVFETAGYSQAIYKHHDVKDVLGSTREEELTPALEKTFAALTPGSSILLVFNGHGGEGHDVYTDNTLDLWGSSAITVAELDQIFDKAPERSTIHFVLPQCFSGGFASLMYRPPGTKRLSPQNRCGFMSQDPHRGAEGCDLDVGHVDYRDYTTYFFAALAGKSRNDDSLASDPDLDRDGRVSFLEAHWYALRTAVSDDLPRSTSEVFLEDWEPRALRDAVVPDNTQSVYWQIAADVAAAHGWSLSESQLKAKEEELTHDEELSEKQENDLRDSIKDLQSELRRLLIKRWPMLRQPYKDLSTSKDQQELKEINAFLNTNADYIRLRDALDALQAAEANTLEHSRQKTQIEKVERMLKLARLKALFDAHASQNERGQYLRLINCEQN
ncbi:MAG: hypothetical protein U1F34_05310 [Gammaproteobacteria bacterium]